MVRNRGIATHLPADGEIASGGVDFFLAGVKRTAEAGAKIGVHSWADDDYEGRELDSNAAETSDLFGILSGYGNSGRFLLVYAQRGGCR